MKRQDSRRDGITVSRVRNSSVNISGGDIHHISTNINTGSGDISQGDKITAINKTFRKLYRTLENMPDGLEKEEAREILGKLESEAQKGDGADQNRVRRWMNFLAETAPDVWEVAVETFINPIAGVGLVFKKIAERAKTSLRK